MVTDLQPSGSVRVSERTAVRRDGEGETLRDMPGLPGLLTVFLVDIVCVRL